MRHPTAVVLVSLAHAVACGSSEPEEQEPVSLLPEVTVPGRTLVWVDRDGREEPLDAGVRLFANLMAVTIEDAPTLIVGRQNKVGQ